MVELPMGIVENHLKQIQIAEDWDVMPNPMLIENHLHKSMMFKEKNIRIRTNLRKLYDFITVAWKTAIWAQFSLLAMIPVRSQWGHYV